MENIIECPQCGAKIELTEVLTASLRAKYEAEANKKARELEKEKKVLTRQRNEIEQEITKRIETERQRIVENERSRLQTEQSTRMNTLRGELEEKCLQLVDANKNELELRKQQQKLKDEKSTFELTIQRKLDEERQTIMEQASKRATEQEQLKLHEKDAQLVSLTKQITELKRRAEIGSQQAAGEALEISLEDILRQTFPFDKFEEVKKGQKGADILQRVRNQSSKLCGSILIESKNTKNFDNAWISKLRKDQQDAKADIAVIITVALPKEIENFGRQNDLWISNVASTIGLITALRQMLIEVTRQKLVSAGHGDMKDLIYDYVTGTEFAMHIKAVVSAFATMQEDLEKEKRALTLTWKKREKQITAVLTNVAGMRGSIEGMAQKALPEVETLTLETEE